MLDAPARCARRYAASTPARARARGRPRGLATLCRCSDAYPERLRELADPPAVLHVLGDPARARRRARRSAVVGARRGTAYGLEVARALGPRARGRRGDGGLRARARASTRRRTRARSRPPGRRSAVLAGGADVPYPARARRLHARGRGARLRRLGAAAGLRARCAGASSPATGSSPALAARRRSSSRPPSARAR